MEIKNYKITADEVISMLQNEPTKGRVLLADILKEYNSINCGIAWKSADQSAEKIFLDNDGNEQDFNKSFPYLEPVSINIKRAQTQPHTIIIGENHKTLMMLQEKFNKQIAFIYCDVPYNTGKIGDFVFNGKSVLDSDPWRDSKWLSAINKRFRLIKELLMRRGVLAVSINDTEVAQLTLLLDEIFGKQNRLAICPVLVNTAGRNKSGIAVQHEYILVYTRDIDECFEETAVQLNQKTKGFAIKGKDSVRTFQMRDPNDIYPRKDVVDAYYEYRRENGDNIEEEYKVTKEALSTYQQIDSIGPFKKRSIVKSGKGSEMRASGFFPVYYKINPKIYKEIDDYHPQLFLQDEVDQMTPEQRKDLYPIYPITSSNKKSGGLTCRRWSWGEEKFRTERLNKNNLIVTYAGKEESVTAVDIIRNSKGEYVEGTGKRTYKYAFIISYREYKKFSESSDSISETEEMELYTTTLKTSLSMFKTVLQGKEYQSQTGTYDLKNLIGNVNTDRANPKPVELIYNFLQAFTKKGDIVADFYLGSGTTLETVLKYNTETGSNLRLIGCTTDQDKVATDFLIPRIEKMTEMYPAAINVFKQKYINIEEPDELLNSKYPRALLNSTETYYKALYGVSDITKKMSEILNISIPENIKILVNGTYRLVVILSKDTTTSTSSKPFSMEDFLKEEANDDTTVLNILNRLSNDTIRIYVKECDTHEIISSDINSLVNRVDLYPLDLIESISASTRFQKEGNVAGVSSADTAEDIQNLTNISTIREVSSDDEDEDTQGE